MEKNNHLKTILFVCFVFFTIPFLNAQDVDKKAKTSRSSYAEKIYLQLSNTVFTTGETLWFKAIVTNTLNQSSQRSGVLYVELIDFDENIIDTKTLKLESGLSDGYFDLSESFPSGRYLVRAYTTWNRNFGPDFIFEQYIDVLDLGAVNKEAIITNISLTETEDNQIKLSANLFPESMKADYNRDLTVYIQSEGFLDSLEVKPKDKQYVLDYSLPQDLVTVTLKVKLEDTKLKNRKRKAESTYSKTIALDKDFLDLQFFPEGGKMIDGLEHKVAYKAINYKGLGAVINGHIVDETDSIIRPFKTNTLGMGFTYFTPSNNTSYYGKIMSKQGVAYKYPLPKVAAQGYVLSLMEIKDYINVTIKSNNKKTERLYFQVRSRGVLIQQHDFELDKGAHEALVKKVLLPNGIVEITLFDSKGVPLCERLFFNSDEDNILNIRAKTNKKTYGQREKTKLNVSISDIDTDPVEASFSALIIDKNKVELSQTSHPNILSYFLLNSELKGFIETPNYYFNSDNELRNRDLEALMLTQGWRDYVYDDTETNLDFEFKPETDVFVSGKVRSVFNENKPPKKPVNLTMITKPDFGLYTSETDSLGKFNFSLNNHFADDLNVLIQSTNKKGKSKNYTISLDDPIESPTVNYKTDETVVLADTIYKAFIEESIVQYQTNNAFKTSSETVALDAVELTGYNVTPEREKIFKLHGPPDIVIENDELVEEEEKWMSGLYDLLRAKFPDDVYFENVSFPAQAFDIETPDPAVTPADTIVKSLEVIKLANTNHAFVFIDGELVEGIDYPLLPYLSVENIKSVEILKRPNNDILQYYQEAFPRNDIVEIRRMIALEVPIVGIISVYTYGSQGIAALSTPKGIFKGKVSGFSAKREFYAPKYDKLEDEDWDVPDVRSVIHWKPLAVTDKRGLGQIEFYNGDNTGDMSIVIEAITPDGKMGYFETSYTVEEKNEK